MRGMLGCLVAVLVAFTVSGCATSQKSTVSSSVLKADHVVYFEQADRIPKAVLLAPYAGGAGTNAPTVGTMGFDQWDKLLDVIEKAFAIAPELAEKYSNERMNNALLNRRMLFIGYDGKDELEAIRSIVEGMGGAIENVTPQK